MEFIALNYLQTGHMLVTHIACSLERAAHCEHSGKDISKAGCETHTTHPRNYPQVAMFCHPKGDPLSNLGRMKRCVGAFGIRLAAHCHQDIISK